MKDFNDLIVNTVVETILRTIKDNDFDKDEIIEYLEYLYRETK